ncbi:hypothetical protein CRG98_036711, partial [Punica granatum]
MTTSWADSVAASENATASDSANIPRPTRPAYVPPHLRNKQPSSDTHAPSHTAPSPGYDQGNTGGFAGGSRAGSDSRPDFGRSGSSGGGWNNKGGGWGVRGRDREVNPFADKDGAREELNEQEQENTGINFDAYEDIPVETSGQN